MSRSSASSGFSDSGWKGARKTPVLRNLSFMASAFAAVWVVADGNDSLPVNKPSRAAKPRI
jgi:hypothetical protein